MCVCMFIYNVCIHEDVYIYIYNLYICMYFKIGRSTKTCVIFGIWTNLF